MTGYFVAILTFVSLAVLLGFALNIQWGQAGMINFGLAGFYGVGAYTAAILSKQGVDGVSATVAAIVTTAAISALVSLATIKLREDYLAITTLAFSESVRLVLMNETWLTGGTNGIRDIPRPFVDLVGGERYELFFLAACIVLVAAVYFLLDSVIRSPFGRALRAVREDDVVAATLGKDVLALRVKAFAIGGAVIGLAGALHAFYFTYIDPGEFAGFVTVYAFMSVIVGGKGSNRGLVMGACTVMILLEGTRFLKDFVPFFTAQQAASLRLIMIGTGLILVLIFRPSGLSSEYRLSSPKTADTTS
ncbi:MAG: branched-chain amino acid ABC transporter permease [Xanthobacteraceae bacterium]|nr:branched-chain amino acid ABC transporter permease [Xanthobacteraceae bacterium]